MKKVDIYKIPVIFYLILSVIEVFKYPQIIEVRTGIPFELTNYILIPVFIFLFTVSRDLKRSEKGYRFLYIGFIWSVLLLIVYKTGGYLETKIYGGFLYSHSHINLNSILYLNYYFFVFSLLLYFEGRLDFFYKKVLFILDHFIKKVLRQSLLELYSELEDM